MFRAPFQVRFDMTLGKEFALNERFRLRFNFDAFNVFNHPDFDAPNNNVTFFPYYAGPPSIPPEGSLGIIQHTSEARASCSFRCTCGSERSASRTLGDDRRSCTGEHRLEEDRTGGREQAAHLLRYSRR